MATMTTDESNDIAACQTALGDAKDALSTARSKLSDAINAMSSLMAHEEDITTQTDAIREYYNEAFRIRALLRHAHAVTIDAIAAAETAHAEGSITGARLWSNFGATYIYGPSGRR